MCLNLRAFKYQGLFGAKPDWFSSLVSGGQARVPEDGPLAVRVITGAWVVPDKGEWVVWQDDGTVWCMPEQAYKDRYGVEL